MGRRIEQAARRDRAYRDSHCARRSSACLYMDALKAYGMIVGPGPSRRKPRPPEARALPPARSAAEAIDISSAPVAPQTAIDRARGIEDTVEAAGRTAREAASESTRYVTISAPCPGARRTRGAYIRPVPMSGPAYAPR